MKRLLTVTTLLLVLFINVPAGIIPQPAPCTGPNCPTTAPTPQSAPIASEDETGDAPTTTTILTEALEILLSLAI